MLIRERDGRVNEMEMCNSLGEIKNKLKKWNKKILKKEENNSNSKKEKEKLRGSERERERENVIILYEKKK